MAISKLSILKVLELAIAATCLGLHYKTMVESEHYLVLLAAGTFVGYVIILAGLFAGHLLQTPINKRLDIVFSLLGCCLFIATGALIINEYNDKVDFLKPEKEKSMVMSKGSLAIINGAVFLVDAVLSFKD